MNIVKLQKQLQNVPDNALVGYVQNPDGQVPSYLALAEISRRKKMREDYQQQAAPEKSVAEAMVAEAQPQGVAGLPTHPDMFTAPETGIMAPVATAAGGGEVQGHAQEIQRYAHGGEVQHFFQGGYPISVPGLSEDDIAYAEALNSSELGNAVTAAYDTLPNFTNPIYKGLGYGIDKLTGYGWVTDPKTGKLIRRKDLPKDADTSKADFSKRMEAGKKERADYIAQNPSAVPNADAIRQQKTKDFLDKQAKENLADPAYIANVNAQKIARDIAAGKYPDAVPGDPGADKPKGRGNGINELPAAQNVPVGNLNAITAQNIDFNEAEYDNAMLKKRTAEDEAARYKAMVGEDKGLLALQDRLKGMEEKALKENESDKWMALANAGFSMAGGKSQHALQNIAEGAKVGIADLAAAKAKFNAAEEKRFGIQQQIAQAQRAEQLAAVKFGTDSEQYADAQNRTTQLHKLDARANVKTHDAANRLAAETANAKNAIEMQSNAWAHEDRQAATRVAAASAAKSSDYETYLQHAKQLPENYKVVTGADGKQTNVFDINKAQSSYWNARGLADVKQQALLPKLYKDLADTFDPVAKARIQATINSIEAGGGGDATAAVPGGPRKRPIGSF